jgi:hypothetical protein
MGLRKQICPLIRADFFMGKPGGKPQINTDEKDGRKTHPKTVLELFLPGKRQVFNDGEEALMKNFLVVCLVFLISSLPGCLRTKATPFPMLPPTDIPGGVQNAQFTLLFGPQGQITQCKNEYRVSVVDPDGWTQDVALEYIVFDPGTGSMVSGGGQPMETVEDGSYSLMKTMDSSGTQDLAMVKYRFALLDTKLNQEYSQWYEFHDAMKCVPHY